MYYKKTKSQKKKVDIFRNTHKSAEVLWREVLNIYLKQKISLLSMSRICHLGMNLHTITSLV